MTTDRAALVGRFLWSLGNFASSFGLRFVSNVILTRLLDPAVFGVMVIVNAMRLGIELLTDVGIEQNIVRHREGAEHAFFNTAWTMQIIRGFCLTSLFLALSPMLAGFYEVDTRIFLAIAFAPLLTSLLSTSVFLAVKNLEVKRRTLFEFSAELAGFIVTLCLVLAMPNVWGLLTGTLCAIAIRSMLSYRLPHPGHRLMIDRGYARQILKFGGWIMVSSVIIFAASNLDRLTLGKIAPLALVGIYGLARTMADIPALMARRLGYQIIFPMLADAKSRGDEAMVASVSPARMKLVLLAAAVIGLGVGCADWAVFILYDSRYADAGWMLSLLLFGTWFSVLSNFNEALLMGAGRPAYETGANVVRFAVLAAGLWSGYLWAGVAGAIAAIVTAEVGRYLFVAHGQRREHLSFFRQDALATLALLAVVGVWVGARLLLGLGDPWRMMLTGLK